MDSIRLFICYVGDISGTNGEEINSVAICGGFTHFQPYMHWTRADAIDLGEIQTSKMVACLKWRYI